MVNKSNYYIWILTFLILVSCNQSKINSVEDYLLWMNDLENGIVKKKEIGGIMIKVKQLPSNYLAYQDLMNRKHIRKELADSLITSYGKSLTFLFTLGVDGVSKGGDIMNQGVKTYSEYKEQLIEMNFGIENKISLIIDGKEYKPILSHLENVYGLTDSRNITLVFVPSEKEDKSFYTSKEIELIYDDELFDTGINHFTFKREDINNTPLFNFWN